MNTGYGKPEIEKNKPRQRGERYAMDPHDQPELHVSEDHGDHVVWLNTGVSDFDGICLAVGKTRDDAVRLAVAVLEWATEQLQQPPPEAK